jgi:hypothetical protein
MPFSVEKKNYTSKVIDLHSYSMALEWNIKDVILTIQLNIRFRFD